MGGRLIIGGYLSTTLLTKALQLYLIGHVPQTGFFGKRRLEKKIRETNHDIEYLRNDIYRYRRGVAWNKKKPLNKITKR